MPDSVGPNGAAGDPWGTDTAPLTAGWVIEPLPPRLADMATLEAPRTLEGPEDPWGKKPRPEELPEVAKLVARGWWPLAWNPLRVAVPAVWPAAYRGWVSDRLPVVGVIGYGVQRFVEPAQWDHDAEQAAYAGHAGLPAPPRRRLWLLRSPFASVGAEVLVRLISRRARQLRTTTQGQEEKLPRLMRRAASEVLGWDESRLWRWWPTDLHREVATAWIEAETDATGDEVADLVAVGLGPGPLARLTSAPPEGGGLTRAQAVASMRKTSGDPEQVLAWRARGLPADPPTGLFGQLAAGTPDEIDTWTGLGYSVYEAFHLLGQPVTDVLALRDAGVEAHDMINELRRDRPAGPLSA